MNEVIRTEEFIKPTAEECETALKVLAAIQSEYKRGQLGHQAIEQATTAIDWYMRDHRLWK